MQNPSRMPAAAGRIFAGVLPALVMLAAFAGSSRAQANLGTNDLVQGLVGLETTPNVDVALLRRMALERIKREGPRSAVNRVPIAEMLFNLP